MLELLGKVREKGMSAYCFFEAGHSVDRVANDPEQDMAAFEKRDWKSDPYVRTIFENDMQGERDSQTLVMLLPAGKSCHIEAGVAYGMGKKCILIGEQKEAESLYHIFSEFYPTIDAFIESLS